MDKKIILSLLGNALLAFALTFIPPLLYTVLFMRDVGYTLLFFASGVATIIVGQAMEYSGSGHRRRLPVIESSISMLLIYPMLAAVGMLPFVLTGWLAPLDAILEAMSDLTSAGLSILPSDAPYILRIWQSILMWFGSLIFLVMLVTIMPEVSGCFGMSLSLHGGRDFSPIFGQMNDMSRRVIKVYSTLTAFSFVTFKVAGLDFWDALLMAMRCISTGGGDYFPAQDNIYAEYAAALTMLIACGNFLFYHRLIYTLPPPITSQQENILRRGINYIKRFGRNISDNARRFFDNTEVKTIVAVIFVGAGFIFLNVFKNGIIVDGNRAFRDTIFHVISFVSTTGINLASIEAAPDFDRYLLFLMAIIGGCMGSVTGGIKIMRVLVLLRVAKAELLETMHPKMVSVIRVNNVIVPTKIIGRILGFFFMAVITLFICAVLLSFTGISFSQSVAASAGCLTTVGILPGICDAAFFQNLSGVGKILCSMILVIGRIEIFALLIVLARLTEDSNVKEW